jgi:ribA/ribD-fused uncharacterized protein
MSDGHTEMERLLRGEISNFYPNTPYYFLSNFYGAEFDWDGYHWLTSENAYQAAKVAPEARDDAWKSFLTCSPGQAKKLGRTVTLRPHWEGLKESIMADIIYAKFTQNPNLKKWLLETGDAKLIEGNYWGDRYWGVCNGTGKNRLGHLLMQLRDKLRMENLLGDTEK